MNILVYEVLAKKVIRQKGPQKVTVLLLSYVWIIMGGSWGFVVEAVFLKERL